MCGSLVGINTFLDPMPLDIAECLGVPTVIVVLRMGVVADELLVRATRDRSGENVVLEIGVLILLPRAFGVLSPLTFWGDSFSFF